MDDMTMKETMKEERKKLGELSFKKKIEYIWDYYKPVMLGIVGVILVIYVGIQMYQGSKVVTELSVAFVNSFIMDGEEAALHGDFVEYGGFTDKNQQVSFDASYVINLEETSEAAAATTMKLAAVIGAKSLDVMVMPEDVYQNYLGMNAYLDLEEVMGTEFLREHEELLQRDMQEEDAKEKVYALKLTGNEKFKGIYGSETVYLTVIANTERTENVKKFVQYVLS